MEESVMENYKRVSILQDDDGHWYVVPYELTEEFNYLLEPFGYPDFVSAEMNDELYQLRSLREDEFMNKFSQYMTGGDINLTELYIKDDKE